MKLTPGVNFHFNSLLAPFSPLVQHKATGHSVKLISVKEGERVKKVSKDAFVCGGC